MQGAFHVKWLILQCLHCLIIVGICACISICMWSLGIRPEAQASRGQTIIVQITGPNHPPGFFPAFITMHINDTVVFINHAIPKNDYSIVAVDGSFSSPSIATDQRWKITFSSPGTHEYRGGSNPLQMVGVFLVVDANVALLPVPNPLIEATVLAVINAQQPLSEAPVLPRLKSQVQIPVSSSPPFFLFFLVTLFGISCAVLLVFLALFYRRYQLQTGMVVEDENEPSFITRYIEHLFMLLSHIRPFIDEARLQSKTRLRAYLQRLFQKRDEEDEWEKRERRHSGRDEDEDF